ncbi:MAG TPA: hypothetical protein VH637_22445 [Streptosporangiaceae bacterium]|jgi:hypothetical protein
MAFFDRTGRKLAAGPTLLLSADPGPELLAAARLYDPGLRQWHGRLVFGNGVLLFGPFEVTPKLAGQAGLPPGTAVAWYAAAAVQDHRGRRPHDAKVADGELLVTGLAARLGGHVFPGQARPPRALLASVYSEQAVPAEEVAGLLRPYAGEVAVEDAKEDSYAISGPHAVFYTAYWSPRQYVADLEPPAAGQGGRQGLHHWDLNTGMRPRNVRHDAQLKLAQAALALAGRAGGVAVDMFGFRFADPQELLAAAEPAHEQ